MTTILQVAEITQDVLFSEWDANNGFTNRTGKKFELEAMPAWWGWQDFPPKAHFDKAPKIEFKLYDDDEELYFVGWLLNDDQCLVQQFVLNWAERDSGCTIIRVKSPTGVGYVQEIG